MSDEKKLVEDVCKKWHKWWGDKRISKEILKHETKIAGEAVEIVLSHIRSHIGEYAEVCKTCGGKGHGYWLNGEKVMCTDCHGSGVVARNGREK